MRIVQYDLFGQTLDQQFDRWLASPSGQQILAEVAQRAEALRSTGFQRYGIKAILESVRYDADLRWGPDTDREPYLVNNNYASRLARHIMATVPNLAGFFEVRELRSKVLARSRAVVIPIQTR